MDVPKMTEMQSQGVIVATVIVVAAKKEEL